MQRLIKTLSIFLIVITVLILPSPLNTVSAYSTPRADRYDFAVTDIKILSAPPFREESTFKIGITVTYNATNYGHLEEQADRWIECEKCGGSGTITVGGTEKCTTCNGAGKKVDKTIIYCARGDWNNYNTGWVCRAQCDGFDYQCNKCKSKYSNNNGGYQGYCNHAGCTGKVTAYQNCHCFKKDVVSVKCPNCNGSGRVGSSAHDVECPSCHGECGKYVSVPPIWTPPSRPSEGNTQLSFTIDGLNQDYAIKDITIPIQGEDADTSRNGSGWSVWGSAYYEIELNTGENIGKKNIEARINWDNKSSETNSSNNTLSTNIDVIPATNLQVELISPNSPYRTDTDVITTYRIINKDDIGELNIKPKHNLTAVFKALKPTTNEVVSSSKVEGIVIPKQGSNIVYFKWRVPADYSLEDIKLQCDINTTKDKNSNTVPGVNETNYDDNTVVGDNKVQKYKVTETPDTVFENRPSWFITPNGSEKVHSPITNNNSTMSATSWEVWEWDLGKNDYVKNTYGLDLKTTQEIAPDVNSPSTEFLKDKNLWQIRSGYGLSLKAKNVVGKNGFIMPKDDKSYTKLQHADAYFPEYKYSANGNKFRTLEQTSENVFEFAPNENSITNKGQNDYRRVHFSPLWYPDGEYQVKTYTYDLWTPSGMLSLQNDLTPMMINGDMYDDWYVNHSERPISRIPTSLSVTVPPTKTTYDEGEFFNATGMIVQVGYNNGVKAVVTNYTFDNAPLKAEQKSIKISYTEHNVTVTTVYVFPKAVFEMCIYEKYNCVLDTCSNCNGRGKVTYSGTCGSCGGSGSSSSSGTCGGCGGSGRVWKESGGICGVCGSYYPCSSHPGSGHARDGGYWTCGSCYGSGSVYRSRTCGSCGGSGSRTSTSTCSTCGGTGNSGYKKATYISDIKARLGAYPENGRHTDGYWYVKAKLSIYQKYNCIDANCSSCNGAGMTLTLCTYCKGASQISCNRCNGSGSIEENCPLTQQGFINCSLCNGLGYTESTTYYWYCRCGAAGKGRAESCTRCRNTPMYSEDYQRINCQTCNGTGELRASVTCSLCNGTGKRHISCTSCNGSKMVRCFNCRGSGKSVVSCNSCKGSGENGYQKSSYVCDIKAKSGSLPQKGRHTDGYWYVLKE